MCPFATSGLSSTTSSSLGMGSKPYRSDRASNRSASVKLAFSSASSSSDILGAARSGAKKNGSREMGISRYVASAP